MKYLTAFGEIIAYLWKKCMCVHMHNSAVVGIHPSQFILKLTAQCDSSARRWGLQGSDNS
jgi:hypothetical protein